MSRKLSFMAGDKRTKPCGNCKKSKVKCEYGDTLPCVRCLNTGIASSCLFLMKLPSLKLPLLNHVPVTYNSTAPPKTPIQLPTATQNSMYLSGAPQGISVGSIAKVSSSGPSYGQIMEANQKGSLEQLERKVDSIDSNFNELLKLLHENQTSIKADRESADTRTQSDSSVNPRIEYKRGLKRNFLEEKNTDTKRFIMSDDFRDDVITLNEAQLLFQFFNQNISQQLFGFEIKNLRVEELWVSSPILVCAIATISLIHFPDPELSAKQPLLQKHLHLLCSNIIFESRPCTDLQVFNTIVALILCSFWLADSQRFTGLALHLAKEHNFNQVSQKGSKKNLVSHKDRLKLWYLLFILDGQQSMSFHRQALLSANDDAVQNGRLLLLNNQSEAHAIEKDSCEVLKTKDCSKASEERRSSFTDLRLVSQVEYNCALDEALKGNAWDLIDPSAFGMPSKSNLELDKWMVSWTVLLAPMNSGSVWLSKSTLIYYNFAKMHINSIALRSLQAEIVDGSILFPSWNRHKFLLNNSPVRHHSARVQKENENEDEEFIFNTELASKDQAMLNLNIAVAAAQTVLSLVLNDSDILDNLKYMPVHIHVMLYYAAFLLGGAPANGLNGGKENQASFRSVFNHLKMIKTLQKKIFHNLPTDQNFGKRLLESLNKLFDERIAHLQREIGAATLEISVKAKLFNEMSTLQCTYSRVEFIPDSADVSSSDSSPQPEKIYAWPASHPGHV